MNTSTSFIVGAVVIVLLVLGGIWYVQSTPSPTATSTPTGTDNTTATPPAQAQPGAPSATTVQSVEPSDTTAIVVGAVVPNGASTDYWYEYGTTANLGSKSSTQKIGSGYVGLAAPAFLTGRAKDTAYYFRLVAQNSFGKTAGITYSFRTTSGTPAPQGSAPTVRTLAATSVTRTEATVNGQATPNQSPTKEWFEYGTTRDFGAVTPVQSIGSGATAVAGSAMLADLAPVTTYYYRLNAQNQFGTRNGATMSFTTLGPALSATPVVTTQLPDAVATTSVILRGTVNPTQLETQYWFEYGISAGFGASTQTTPKKTLAAAALTLSAEATVTGLRSNTTYFYRMVAQNSAGMSSGTSQSFKTK